MLEIWIEMMVMMGLFPSIVLDRARPSFDAYRNRDGAFETFIRAIVAAYSDELRMRGIRVSDAVHVAERVVKTHGLQTYVFTRELARAAAECGYRRSFISGAPKIVVDPFARLHGFDPSLCYGTVHPQEDGFFTGQQAVTWFDRKGQALDELRAEHRLDLRRSVAIGDTESDIPMLERVGYPLCMCPNSALLAVAVERRWPVIIERKDVIYVLRSNRKRRLAGVSPKSILPADISPLINARVGCAIAR